jgi:hypothetical protein
LRLKISAIRNAIGKKASQSTNCGVCSTGGLGQMPPHPQQGRLQLTFHKVAPIKNGLNRFLLAVLTGGVAAMATAVARSGEFGVRNSPKTQRGSKRHFHI